MGLIKSVLVLVMFCTSTLVSAGLPLHDSQGQPLPSLAPMLERVNPAVVNISTFTSRRASQNPLLSDPFFRRFFNIPEQNFSAPRREQSAGSGVIVDADKGVVLTNYHVIRGADEVQVALIDGRTFKAKLAGADPELDIAVLKIDGRNLSEVPLAKSDELRVGDFVVAIGNPFGLGQTVTTGIVSALGRSGLGIEGYENFIQTDASINPGNSGGALVNLRGELVGINTAIISPGGGNVGIGFAIPTRMARASMKQILANGQVKRGVLGVSIQDVTPDLREAFGLKRGEFGVLITGVAEDSPAERAGIRSGDIVLAIDGTPIKNSAQLRSLVGLHGIGEEVDVRLLRDNRRVQVRAEVVDPRSLLSAVQLRHPLMEGISLADEPGVDGVRVIDVAPDSAAAMAGLEPDDLIRAVNKRRIRNLEGVQRALSLSRGEVLLRINRGRRNFYVLLR